MPNNSRLYNAVLIGATGGILTRWISQYSTSSYTAVLNAVRAIAEEVDSKIPSSVFLTNDQYALIQSIARAVFDNRFPQSASANSYNDIADAILAAYTELNSGISQPGVSLTFNGLNQVTYPNTRVLLPAGHQAGEYLLSRWMNVTAFTGGGSTNEAVNCSGPSGSSVAGGWAAVSMGIVRQLGSIIYLLSVKTTGLADITCNGVNSGTTTYSLDANYTVEYLRPL